MKEKFTAKTLGILLALVLTTVIMASMAYAGKPSSGGGSTVTITVQTVTNRYEYSPGGTLTVRGVATKSSTKGIIRLTSDKISAANVTITNPSGSTVLADAAMSKDLVTGLCYYQYNIPTNAPKGVWTVKVTISDANNNSGTGSNTFKVLHAVPDHSTLISSYQGTTTCISCHSAQADSMFNSVHYQWKGDTSKAIELQAAGSNASKLGSINDFCMWPDGNWLTILNRLDGKTDDGGCAECHAGLGLKPTATKTTQQLENIDCLICHSPTYKRKVVQNADGTFKMAPDPSIDIQAAAKNIVRPGRAECMRCHAESGGSENYKRGDLESKLVSCDYSYDVHMGTNGQNFRCADCHRTVAHKIAGRGSDMRTTETSYTMSCESCHSQIPHRSSNASFEDIDRHTDRVYCTTCHIPTFAKTSATDMDRNWSIMEVDPNKQLYDPEITKQTNVKPVYTWFNDFSHFYNFKDPVSLDSRGVQKMSWPDGGFMDVETLPWAKFYPFKLHKAELPMENTTKQIVPVKNKVAFETGDINEAIRQGAAAAGMSYTSHTFIPAERYLGIFHGVGPKSTARNCSNLSCHGNENVIPYSQLGYTRRGTTDQLCDICHTKRTYTDFNTLHSKHRDAKNCTACHGTGYTNKEPQQTLCDNCHRLRTSDDPNWIHTKHCQAQGLDCSNCHTYTGDPGKVGHGQIHDKE